MIALLHLNLCHEIPVSSINKGVLEIGKWLSYGKVEVQFQALDGKNQKVYLFLKKYRESVLRVTSLLQNTSSV